MEARGARAVRRAAARDARCACSSRAASVRRGPRRGGCSTARSTSSGATSSRWTTRRRRACWRTARTHRGRSRRAGGGLAGRDRARRADRRDRAPRRRVCPRRSTSTSPRSSTRQLRRRCSVASAGSRFAPSLAEGVAEFLLGDSAAEVICEGVAARLPHSPDLALLSFTRCCERSSTRRHANSWQDSEAKQKRLARHLAERGAGTTLSSLSSASSRRGSSWSCSRGDCATMLERRACPHCARGSNWPRRRRLTRRSSTSPKRRSPSTRRATKVGSARRFAPLDGFGRRTISCFACVLHRRDRARTWTTATMRHERTSTKRSRDRRHNADRRDAIWGQLIVSLDLRLDRCDRSS